METEIPQKTENQEKKRKRTKFTPSVLLNIILIIGVLLTVAVVLYAPRTDFFKGALLLRPQTENISQLEEPKEIKAPGALLIDYVTKSSDVEVNGKLITLTSFVLEAEDEEMSINSFLFEFGGDLEDYSITDTKLLVDGHEIESSNYVWISPQRLLVEVSSEEVRVKDRLPIILQGILGNVNSEEIIHVLVSDVSAVGFSSDKHITNIGAKGATDAAGTALHIK